MTTTAKDPAAARAEFRFFNQIHRKDSTAPTAESNIMPHKPGELRRALKVPPQARQSPMGYARVKAMIILAEKDDLNRQIRETAPASISGSIYQ